MELDITTLHGRFKKSGQFGRGSFQSWCRYNISFKTCLPNRWAQKTENIHLHRLIFPVSYGLTLRTNLQPNRILMYPEPVQTPLTWFPSWEKIGNTGGQHRHCHWYESRFQFCEMLAFWWERTCEMQVWRRQGWMQVFGAVMWLKWLDRGKLEPQEGRENVWFLWVQELQSSLSNSN